MAEQTFFDVARFYLSIPVHQIIPFLDKPIKNPVFEGGIPIGFIVAVILAIWAYEDYKQGEGAVTWVKLGAS